MTLRKCGKCGKVFVRRAGGRGRPQRFCSADCRVLYFNDAGRTCRDVLQWIVDGKNLSVAEITRRAKKALGL